MSRNESATAILNQARKPEPIIGHGSRNPRNMSDGHDDKGRLENKISFYIADGKGGEGRQPVT